jgi:phospholipase/carboxylesterase
MLESELIAAEDRDSKWSMVVLHGLGDSREGYRWMPAELDLPWLNYVLVDAPDPYYGGYAWYDFSTDPGPGILRSRHALTALLDHRAKAGFAPEQTILFGFSQGCLMALDVGLRYPSRLAGLIGISGYVHEPATLMRELSPWARQTRILLTHGRFDPLIPADPVRRQVAELKGAGLKIEWHEFDKAHTIEGEAELGLLRGTLKSWAGITAPGSTSNRSYRS